MSYKEFIANSNLAFGGNEFDVALDYAKKAIKAEPKQTDGYYCAGKAYMSLGKTKEAVEYFQKAINLKENGNGYFLLGYALTGLGNFPEALKNLTRAIENNCDKNLKGQIYKIMSLINTDMHDYKNALVNLKQAEELVGIDYELLQQTAVCYANLKDYKQTLYTLNQMKLIRPNDYLAYSLAFHIFMETEIYDEALAELERAEKYAELNISYYNDRIAYTLMHDPDKDTEETQKQKWTDTLSAIDVALKKGKPTGVQVFELYLRSANIYIAMDNPEKALSCLDSSLNPVLSFNSGFSVLPFSEEIQESPFYDDMPEGLSPEEQEDYMQERWDNGEFTDIEESINDALMETDDYDESEDISQKVMDEVYPYFSPVDRFEDSASEPERYTISEEFKPNTLQHDTLTTLYMTVYEMQKDYENMLKKARDLQGSDITGSQYTGIYYELKYGKYTGADNWQKKYEERIHFWTRCMIENPTDYLAGSYRVRSYLDLGDIQSAEQLCSCLPMEIKKSLRKEIEKVKSQGGE